MTLKFSAEKKSGSVSVQLQTSFNHCVLFQAIADSITTQEDDALMKCLIEMAENVPKFLRSQMETIFPFCLKVSLYFVLVCGLTGILVNRVHFKLIGKLHYTFKNTGTLAISVKCEFMEIDHL